MDSENEPECHPRGKSPYRHASLWDIIMYNYCFCFVFASVEFVLNWLLNSVTPQTHFEVQMRDRILDFGHPQGHYI